MADNIPDGITRDDVLTAIADFDAGVEHEFAPSTGYDLRHNDKPYPPKAILGLAARRTAGRMLVPADFSGGEDSKCFKILRDLDFTIDPKPDVDLTRPKRNPKWQRDEIILALDLYFKHSPSTISQNHEDVVRVSEILNALPIHKHRNVDEKFRNPNGVYMKMCNFLAFDPAYTGSGLGAGSKLDKIVWDEFANDREGLQKMAKAIADGYQTVEQSTPENDEDEDEFPEGRVLYRMHRSRERNTQLVKKAKAKATREGNLSCVVCDFDFCAKYGEIGQGFIECHHTKPISDYEEGEKTKLEDLALVCSNCHRMLHRRRPWLTINELKCLIE